MMVEFCCAKCGNVKIEPSQLHEDPRNPQTCTACAVRGGKLSPPPTTEIRPNRPTFKCPTIFEPGYRVMTVSGCVAIGFFVGFLMRGGV